MKMTCRESWVGRGDKDGTVDECGTGLVVRPRIASVFRVSNIGEEVQFLKGLSSTFGNCT